MQAKLLTLEGNYNFSEPYLKKNNDSRFRLELVFREKPSAGKPPLYLQTRIGGELIYISSLFPKREKIRGQFINGYKLDYNGYYYFLYFMSEGEVITQGVIIKQCEKGYYSGKNGESPKYNNRTLSRIDATERKKLYPRIMPGNDEFLN